MLGGQRGRLVRVPVDDGLGQYRVLVQRPAADLRAVGLSLEPEADVVPDAQAEVGQVRVVRGVRDGPVQRQVGHPGGVAVLTRPLVVRQRAADGLDVGVGPAQRRGPGDLLLDDLPEVQQ